MDLLPLLGVLIVIAGSTLKFDAILIMTVALIATALTGRFDLVLMLEILGAAFVNNQGVTVSIIVMLATKTLERSDLKGSAATLIKRFKKVSAGVIADIYGVFRIIFTVLNVSFGGAIGFVRPIILPMALGVTESRNLPVVPGYEEELKGMASAMENICRFFDQIPFVGRAGASLIRSTSKDLGYEVTSGKLVLMEVPVALVALISASTYFTLKEKRLRERYYGQEGLK